MNTLADQLLRSAIKLAQSHSPLAVEYIDRALKLRELPSPPAPRESAVDDGELVLMLADRLGARVLAMLFSRVRVRRGPENLEIWLDCGFDSWWGTAADVEARVAKLLKVDELEMLAARDVLGAIFCWPRTRRRLKESLR